MIKIESVSISDEALLRVSDLIRNSEKLAHLTNEISSISYGDLVGDAFIFDQENGDDFFCGPCMFFIKTTEVLYSWSWGIVV